MGSSPPCSGWVPFLGCAGGRSSAVRKDFVAVATGSRLLSEGWWWPIQSCVGFSLGLEKEVKRGWVSTQSNPRQSVSPGSPPFAGAIPPAWTLAALPPCDARVLSQCSRSCGGGMKVRDVHCVDTRDQRLLRPFHCQAVLYKPPAQLPCHSTPCLDWYTSSWREVGAAGEGAEPGSSARPPSIAAGRRCRLGTRGVRACDGVSRTRGHRSPLPGSTFGRRSVLACPEQALSSRASAWPGG